MRTDARELLAVGIFGGQSQIGHRIDKILKRGCECSVGCSPARMAATAATLCALMLASSAVPRWVAFGEVLRFAVASIKSDHSGGPANVLYRKGGRFTAESATPWILIANAFELREHQISGGPAWIHTDRFTVDARVSDTTPDDPGTSAMRTMVQTLLADRFKLAFHRETREEQVFELVREKPAAGLKGVTDPGRGGTRARRAEIDGMAASVSDLVHELSNRLGRSVIDKTGLTARYDFSLRWMPEVGEHYSGPDETSDGTRSAPELSDTSLFTAIREQLGLRLIATRGPVDILVIDHIEKPDAN